VARPTICTPELIAKAWKYHEGEWQAVKHTIPSHVGLADYLNVAESSLYVWAEKEGSQFSEILAAIKAKQQLVLLNKGLDGTFSAPITKLVLGKHGFHEQVKADHTVNDYTNMSSEDRRRRLMELQQELQNAERG
jgi:hypothetical protein